MWDIENKNLKKNIIFLTSFNVHNVHNMQKMCSNYQYLHNMHIIYRSGIQLYETLFSKIYRGYNFVGRYIFD